MGGTPSLDLLGMFVAVAESASFSAAAKKLGLPKSSVSRGIARLEAELDTQLLHRTTHAVGLTTSGTALFERVAPLVASLRQAVGSLPEEKETPSGVLRVTLGPELGTATRGCASRSGSRTTSWTSSKSGSTWRSVSPPAR